MGKRTRERKQPHRKKSGNRTRTSVYVDRELLFACKEEARRRNISLCDYVEEALRLRIAMEGYAELLQKRHGGLTTMTIHVVDRIRREASDKRAERAKPKAEPSSTKRGRRLYCQKCEKWVPAIPRAMRLRCPYCDGTTAFRPER